MQHWYLCFCLCPSVRMSPSLPLTLTILSPPQSFPPPSFSSSPSLMSNEEVIWTQLDLTNAIILKWALILKCNCVISWKCFSSKTKELRVKFTQIAHAGKKEPSGKFAVCISQSTFIPQQQLFLHLVNPDWFFSSVLIFSLLNRAQLLCWLYSKRKDKFI